jgi:hypothetical protein
MLSCEDHVGHKVLSDSPATACEGGEYGAYVAVAYTVLIVYIAPIAFIIYGFLYMLEKKNILR